MLIKAERIISHGNVLLDKSEDEIFRIVQYDLACKIAEEMVRRGLIKAEITNSLHDDFGSITKIQASVRAYHPDD